MKRIVILGGGTGGTLAANRLRRAYDDEAAEIVVVDRDTDHVYQPGLLFVPFGLTDMRRIVRPRRQQFRHGISFRQAGIDGVDVGTDLVHLDDGTALSYDVLVVATGARLLPEETDGLTGPGWLRDVFTFYTPDGAVALHRALEQFSGGRLVVNVIDMPIKCPVAPLEFSFLADWYFRRRGIRDRVELSYVTPLDGAFTKPVCNQELSGLLADKGIELVTEFNTGTVDPPGDHGEANRTGRLISYDEREVPFDLAVVVPLHGGAGFVGRSPGLGDELGFIPVDPGTLQSRAQQNVFALGDATDVPTSKAGSVAHFEGDVLTGNVRRFLAGQPLTAAFDGHTNCFIETGFGKALLIDFNYDTEPLTGHYPARLGLPLLKQSRLNHLGKLAFQQFYWHGLLPGYDVPGISSAMPARGKTRPRAQAATAAGVGGHR
ncbi:MAG TPA: FAD/NAD(P)-binding oxidoreductase [Streptosporangiaceae bacterium]|nr:FAD/NAD(P)-binding oxidoreductase [Streptosporangiaceae bacterium]